MFAQIDSPFSGYTPVHILYFTFHNSYFIFYIFQVVRSSLSLPPLRRGGHCSSFKHLVFLLGCPALLYSSFFALLFLLLCKGDNNSTITCTASNSPLSPKRLVFGTVKINNENNEKMMTNLM